MEKCVSPIYNVINTIAKHSEKLFKAIKNLQYTVYDLENEDFVVVDTGFVPDVNDFCFCDTPPQESLM